MASVYSIVKDSSADLGVYFRLSVSNGQILITVLNYTVIRAEVTSYKIHILIIYWNFVIVYLRRDFCKRTLGMFFISIIFDNSQLLLHIVVPIQSLENWTWYVPVSNVGVLISSLVPFRSPTCLHQVRWFSI